MYPKNITQTKSIKFQYIKFKKLSINIITIKNDN